MSIAIAPAAAPASKTCQQFLQACVLVAGLLGVGCILYAIESLLLRCERRFVENPADTMTRAVGLAHFSIGWLFLFTSPRLRNRVALGRLTFWTLFGAAFCALFAWGNGDKNPLLQMAFYSFFFIHEAYDEAYLFRTSGELPADTAGADRFLNKLALSVCLTFVTLMASLQLLRGHILGRLAELRELPLEWLLVGWAIGLVCAGVAILTTVRLARSLYGSVADTVEIFRPLLSVYTCLIGILFFGSLFGSIGPNLVILIHGMTWLASTCRRLDERPIEVTGFWTWLRGTPMGLIVLHVSVGTLALSLFALRTHVWERTGLICDLVSKTWFPYWAIMHIAMSFWRK